jgi:hypothetical protein
MPVGVSLSLVGGASAATAVPTADTASWDTSRSQFTLNEEEIADVSLGTFYVFDKEHAGTPYIGEKVAQRCGGCRGCRGCGRGRGCGGYSCCLSWGYCRIC